MAYKLSNLLKKVFFGSLAGIAASNTNTAYLGTLVFQPEDDDNKLESLINKKVDLSPKLILKRTSNDEWAFMSHRSHRSHSSHRSHYSSSSGGGSGNNNSKSNSGIQSNTNINNISKNTTTTLQLGARTLKKGMYGTDVTELVNILLRKKYLKLDDGGTQVTGSYTFDETIEDAVKVFQSDNGLTSDGICGSTTIYYLKNK